jgi:hypothetical protein
MTSNLLNVIINPQSSFTRPANTTAYAQNNLVGTSTTAASCVVPSFATGSGPVSITRFRLTTDITTGWTAPTFNIRIWNVAPTYSAGDGSGYAIATGGASLLGTFSITLAQFADAASGAVTSFQPLQIAPLSGVIFWDIQYTASGSLTPISAQTFTLTAECAA